MVEAGADRPAGGGLRRALVRVGWSVGARAVGAVLLGWSCAGPVGPPLQPTIAGCALEPAAMRCVAEPSARPVVLWFAEPLERVVVRRDAEVVPAEVVAVQGGTRVTLGPRQAGRWCVEHGGAPWCVELTLSGPDPAVEAARALARSGALSDALARVEGLSTAEASSLRARVLQQLGRGEEAAQAYQEAVTLHAARGAVEPWAHDGLALVWLLRERGLLSEARALLDTLAAPAAATGREGAWSYHRALVARDGGDLRGAIDWLQRAERSGERFADERTVRSARQVHAVLLAELGRTAEALETLGALRAALPAGEHPCAQVDLAVNEAWVSLLHQEAGGQVDAAARLGAAMSLLDQGCGGPDVRAVVAVDLARSALLAGEPEQAARWLDSLPPAPGWAVRALAADLRAELLLARGEPAAAIAAWEELAARGGAAGAPEVAWRAQVGVARAAQAAGWTARAVSGWQRAEALLDAQVLAVPLALGREALLADRERSARGLVGALLGVGRVDEALLAARSARARALRGLAAQHRVSSLDAEARAAWEVEVAGYRRTRDAIAAEAEADWELPRERLAEALAAREARSRAALQAVLTALEQGETPPLPSLRATTVLVHPLDDGHVLFLADAAGVAAVRLGAQGVGLAEVAEALGPDLRARLAAAQRVRLLVSGELRALDWSALPIDGAPLRARAPVVHALDLPVPAASPAEGVVVFGDARGDLAAARHEAGEVAAALGAGPPLLGAQVTAPALRAALLGASLVHVAGHGRYEEASWQSGLALAGGGSFTVGDLLALPRAPRRVVLSGCETGRAAAHGAVEGLGLAVALVLAGSAQVLASVEPVDDVATARLMAALYQADPTDLAVALAGALTRQPEPGASSPWRVVEP